MQILPAKKEHAHLIGKAVTMAIGDEITRNLAGESHCADDVEKLFTALAGRDDTQYSYRNTLVAQTADGQVAGLAVAYDGAGLITMRRIFFSEAADRIGLTVDGNIDDIAPETTPDEFYLDTLAVFAEYRGQGIARQLLKATKKRADAIGKPLGLLVDKTNVNARRLYDSAGFVKKDERPFAGEIMDHLIM